MTQEDLARRWPHTANLMRVVNRRSGRMPKKKRLKTSIPIEERKRLRRIYQREWCRAKKQLHETSSPIPRQEQPQQ